MHPRTAVVGIFAECCKAALQEWLGDSTFYRIERDRLADNPDQRIAVDLESFANTTLSLTLDLLSTLETLVWFSIFLWSTAGALSIMIGGTPVQIPSDMLWATVVHAIAGSFLTNKVGHPLVSINYQLQRVEADFRFGLIRLLLPASSGDCYRQALPSCT